MLKQAVFLVGGLGSRLKHLTQSTPKPLIEVAGQPFLDILIAEAARQGFDDILLLAGYLGEQMRDRYNGKVIRGAKVRVLVEPEPLGTGGALRFALPHLSPEFLLANGDTFFDINLRALAMDVPQAGGVMALRGAVKAARYGRVKLHNGVVEGFDALSNKETDPINGGVYALNREVATRLGEGRISLESEIFPELARKRFLRGVTFDNYFVDIGIPEDLQRARGELSARLTRPALFLDRDGVLNNDNGYVHRREEFEWFPGAREIVRHANDKGWFVFVVTNQAGVARGLYEERDINALHTFMQEELAAIGAHIDAFEYCPHHPDGIRASYRKDCERRKPSPGMIHDLLRAWPVDTRRSLLVGDKAHDVAAGEAAGLRGFLFPGGNIMDFISKYMDNPG